MHSLQKVSKENIFTGPSNQVSRWLPLIKAFLLTSGWLLSKCYRSRHT